MFIVSAKLTKKKLIGTIVIAGILLIGTVFFISTHGSVETSSNISTKAKTNDQRVDYLTQMGWEVTSEPSESQEVLIPGEWDTVFESYNQLQTPAGFDLAKFKGKRVMRYTYTVSNYPTGEKNVLVNMLCYKNNIIGGDVQSPSLDGFMHGLEKNSSTPSPISGTDSSIKNKCTQDCICPSCPQQTYATVEE